MRCGPAVTAILTVDIICLNAALVTSIELANLAPARAGRDNAPELAKLTAEPTQNEYFKLCLFIVHKSKAWRPIIFYKSIIYFL